MSATLLEVPVNFFNKVPHFLQQTLYSPYLKSLTIIGFTKNTA